MTFLCQRLSVSIFVCRAVLGSPLVLDALYPLRFADATDALVSCLHVSVCVAAFSSRVMVVYLVVSFLDDFFQRHLVARDAFTCVLCRSLIFCHSYGKQPRLPTIWVVPCCISHRRIVRLYTCFFLHSLLDVEQRKLMWCVSLLCHLVFVARVFALHRTV